MLQPNCKKRAVDIRASLLNREYLKKPVMRTDCSMELKNCVNWGGGEQAIWCPDCSTRYNQWDGWPVLRSKEAERSIAITSIKRRIVIATVKAQASSLLGRLQIIAWEPVLLLQEDAMLRNLTDNGRRKRKHLNWWLGKASAPSEWGLHFLTSPLL